MKARRFVLPLGGAAALVLGAGLLLNQGGVHAASSAASPLDDQSVSSLVALDQAVEAVAARVTPAVVNVAVTSHGSAEHAAVDEQEQGQQEQGLPQGLPPGFAQFFGGQMPGQMQRQPQGAQIEHGIGSGVIISPDGYIVTNNHVVDGAVQMRVTLNDRRVLDAKLVGTDKLTDLAVIKVEAKGLPSIAWGDSTKLHPGQTVLAFGSPFGYLQFSVTRGIISAVDRPNRFSGDARSPGGLIQTDAAINPGNSGGPLVNAHGELIGINNGIVTESGSFAGAGFAIPSQVARATVEQLIKSGVVHHGYLGISLNDVTPANAGFFHLQDASGAIVAQVTPDSPASRAGVHQGDVIRQVNGAAVLNSGALQIAVSEAGPGKTVALGILRDGATQTVKVTVGEFHGSTEVANGEEAPAAKGGRLGLAVNDLDAGLRQQLGVPSQVQGVAVRAVRPASPAEDAGLAPGDVILEVNRRAIPSAQEFVSAVRANAPGKDLLLLVWSKGNASYRVVRPENG